MALCVYGYLGEGRIRYVGSTKRRKGRFKNHRTESEFVIDYTNGDFIILEDNIPKNQIKEREEYWIAEYDTYHNGYNRTPKHTGGGEWERTDEHRYKASIRASESNNRPEVKKKLSDKAKERYKRPGERAKQSQRMRKALSPLKVKKRQSDAAIERWKRSEEKEKQSHRTRTHWGNMCEEKRQEYHNKHRQGMARYSERKRREKKKSEGQLKLF